MTLRLANADVVPFEFNNFTDTVSRYIREVSRLTDTMRDETKSRNALLRDGVWAATLDPQETYILPKPEADVPVLNFAPLNKALTRLQESSRNYDAALQAGRVLSPDAQKELDKVLYQTERAMTSDAGLPRRSWFKHAIYAPGFYTGYGVKTLPGAREAIEQRNWTEASEQINLIAATLEKLAGEIDRATQLIGK